MELVYILIGILLGWMLQLGLDHLTYRRSPEFERALAEADRRVKALELELAGSRAAGSAEGIEIRDGRIHHLEDTLREKEGVLTGLTEIIADLEARLESAHVESPLDAPDEDHRTALQTALAEAAEAAERQRTLESRLMDVETEIATIRHAPLRDLNADADPYALAGALEDRDRQIATLRLDLERMTAIRETVAS